jgi:hypothetical protein
MRSADARPGRSRLVAGVAVALLLALVAAVVAAVVSNDDDPTSVAVESTSPTTGRPPTTEAPATSAAPGSTTPPTTARPGTTAAPTEFDREVDAIIAIVEKERGLRFKTRPTVLAMAEAEFVARFETLNREHYEEHTADYDAATVVLGALGFLRNNLSYYETAQAFGSAGVLGFYDPETDELAVRGGTMTPFVRTVVAHELVHALDDQWFDLDRPEYDDAKDEIGFGFSAIAEGNARRIENLYRETLTAAERASAEREELSYGGSFPTQKFTTSFLKLQLAPYTLGEALVDELYAIGGQKAVDAAFVSPPRTSEQVIDVDTYRAGEGPARVDPPKADGPVVEDGIMGQLVIQYLLETVVSAAQANRAASGWAGDWYVAWTANGASCVRATVAMDTPADTADLKTALDRWVASRPSGNVTAGVNSVTFTACTR